MLNLDLATFIVSVRIIHFFDVVVYVGVASLFGGLVLRFIGEDEVRSLIGV